jgi:hypothetical protein
MAHSAHARPAAVYSVAAGLAVLSVCGFMTGLRLYLPHHRTAEAPISVITTPAPAIPPVAPVAVAQAEPTPTPHHSHANRDDIEAITDASAQIGDQADAAALTPADHPATDATDAPGVSDAQSPLAQPEETRGQDAPRADADAGPTR